MPNSREDVKITSNELFWYIKSGERVRQIRKVTTHPFEACLDDREETIGILCTALAECQRERDELRAQLAAAVEALIDAKESVESWGSYASDYFKEKHGYLDDLQNIQQAIDFLSSVDVVRSLSSTSPLVADILKACDEWFDMWGETKPNEIFDEKVEISLYSAIKKSREV